MQASQYPYAVKGYYILVDAVAKMQYNYGIGSNCYTGDGRGGWATVAKLVGTN